MASRAMAAASPVRRSVATSGSGAAAPIDAGSRGELSDSIDGALMQSRHHDRLGRSPPGATSHASGSVSARADTLSTGTSGKASLAKPPPEVFADTLHILGSHAVGLVDDEGLTSETRHPAPQVAIVQDGIVVLLRVGHP